MHQYVPVYSGKQMDSGDLVIFFSKMSFLFRKRMIEVSLNHLLLQMESNSFKDSCIRFCERNVRGLKRHSYTTFCMVIVDTNLKTTWHAHIISANVLRKRTHTNTKIKNTNCTSTPLKYKEELGKLKWQSRTEVLGGGSSSAKTHAHALPPARWVGILVCVNPPQ